MGLSGEALAVMAEEGMTRDSSISVSAGDDVRTADGADGVMQADGVVTTGNAVPGNEVFSV